MKASIELTDKIDAYLMNKMTDEERQQFESQIASDRELQLEVGLQRDIIFAIQVADLKQELKERRKRINVNWRYWVSSIAVAACILGIVFFNNSVNSLYQYGGDELSALQYVSQSDMRGGDGLPDLSYIKAIVANKDFVQADDLICRGLKNLEDPILDTDQKKYYKDNLEWLQTLSYTQQKKYFKACKLLKQIKNNTSHLYTQEAKELLEKL